MCLGKMGRIDMGGLLVMFYISIEIFIFIEFF